MFVVVFAKGNLCYIISHISMYSGIFRLPNIVQSKSFPVIFFLNQMFPIGRLPSLS